MFDTSPAYPRLTMAIATVLFGYVLIEGSMAQTSLANQSSTSQPRGIDKRVISALHQCQKISPSCAAMTQNAPGILVFPSVIKADVLIGGAGGKGALIENGQITGYYNIGLGSVGLQAGVDRSSQVYVFRTQNALARLKQGQDWKVGAGADVTLMKDNSVTHGTSGNVLAYVFNAQGLHGGVSLDVFDVWKTGKPRPQVDTNQSGDTATITK